MKKRILNLLVVILVGLSSTISAQPMASFTLSDTVVCSGTQVNLINTSSGAIGYQWYVDNEQISSAVNTSFKTSGYGTKTVALVALGTGGNNDTAYSSFRTLIKPNYSFSFDQNISNPLCLGTELTISPWSNFNGVDSLHWDFGDGTSSDLRFPRKIYNTTGAYTIVLDVFGRCGADQQQKSVTITDSDMAKPQLNLNANSMVCPGDKIWVSAYDLASAGVDYYRIYTGDGNMTSKPDFQYVYEELGSYTISAVAGNACGMDSVTTEVVVTDTLDKRYYLYASPNKTCPDNPVLVQLGLEVGDYAVIDFGDGSKDTFTYDDNSVQHSYTNDGTYKLTAHVYPVCGKEEMVDFTLTVDANLAPDVFGMSLNATNICPGEAVNIYMPFIYPTDTLFVDFGDGQVSKFIGTPPATWHTYMNNGNYLIRATRKNVCGNSRDASTSVSVGPQNKIAPSLYVGYGNQAAVQCKGDSIMYTASTYRNRELKSIHWKFSDGMEAYGQYVKRVYDKNGTYRAVCTYTDKCDYKYRLSHDIDVTDRMNNPRALFWVHPEVDCVNYDALFDNVSQNHSKMVWDFGDGTTKTATEEDFHTFHAYKKAGKYLVELTATNGCGMDVHTDYFTAVQGPISSFDQSHMSVTMGDTVSFTSTSTDAVKTVWVLPDGSEFESNSMTYIFTESGAFKIGLRTFGAFGCEDYLEKQIQVGGVGTRFTNDTPHFKIYPNPTKGAIHIDYRELSKAQVSLSVYDIFGRALITSKGVSTIDLKANGLQSGTYILRFEYKGESGSQTIVLY